MDSTGERNGLGQCSSQGTVIQGLARTGVELERNQIEVVLTVYTERSVLRGRYCLKSLFSRWRLLLTPGVLGERKALRPVNRMDQPCGRPITTPLSVGVATTS